MNIRERNIAKIHSRLNGSRRLREHDKFNNVKRGIVVGIKIPTKFYSDKDPNSYMYPSKTFYNK